MTAALRAEALAKRLGQLRPDWGRPDRYFESRNEIERELRQLAKSLENH